MPLGLLHHSADFPLSPLPSTITHAQCVPCQATASASASGPEAAFERALEGAEHARVARSPRRSLPRAASASSAPAAAPAVAGAAAPAAGREEHLGRLQVGGATGTPWTLQRPPKEGLRRKQGRGRLGSLVLSPDPLPAAAPCALSRRDQLRPQPPRSLAWRSRRPHRAAPGSYEP